MNPPRFAAMKFAAVIASLLVLALPLAAKEFKIYAAFTEETKVELSDGAIWVMDKGDVFPILAYKDLRKNIVLQLGGTSFMTETARIRVLEKSEEADGIESYRKNLRAFLDSTSKKLQAALQEAEGVKAKKPE